MCIRYDMFNVSNDGHDCFSGSAWWIHGVVKDSKSGDTLPGAKILIVGTSKGTASDLNGEFP